MSITLLLRRNRWTPKRLPGVVAGWDFSKLVSTVVDGGAISSVDPVVGTAPLVGSGANRPVLALSGINGRPAAQFTSGSSHFMTSDAVAAYVTGDDMPFTLLGVVQASDLGALTAFASFGHSSGNQRHWIGKNAADAGNVGRRGDADGATTNAAGSASYAASPVAFAQVFTGTTATIYTGTAMTANPSAGALNLSSATFSRFSVGCLRLGANSQFMTGFWGELYICVGAVPPTGIERFTRYAQRKWGTA
jgi:hypothetical protein